LVRYGERRTGEQKLVNGDAKPSVGIGSCRAVVDRVGIDGNSQWFVDLVRQLAMKCGSGMPPRSVPVMCARALQRSKVEL